MSYKQMVNEWLNGPIDGATREELSSLDENALQERFYKFMEFGTAGMRGIMGAGTNNMNIYTVRHATQGLADFINAGSKSQKGVVIAYDPRINSELFAHETAGVLVANGVKTYLFDGIRSVPLLSFAVRELQAEAGILITASHNPPKYNGYKVFGSDGGQLAPEPAKALSSYIGKVGMFEAKTTPPDALTQSEHLIMIGESIDRKYFDRVLALSLSKDVIHEYAGQVKIAYTPLHGGGGVPVQRVLHEAGVKNVFVVEEQLKPDGHFPTVKSPNPEDAEGFKMALDLARQHDCDVAIGTDPDVDRLGVAIRVSKGEYRQLTGNEIGCLMMYYYLNRLRELGKMPDNAYVIKSIVTTGMADAIAEGAGVRMVSVLTGFRNFAEYIQKTEATNDGTFIMGFEESNGYTVGTFVRDKDAITASLIICEATIYYHSKGESLAEVIDEIYKKYGYYQDIVKSYVIEGMQGLASIQNAVNSLRGNPREAFTGQKVVVVDDYQLSARHDLITGEKTSLAYSKSNVLCYTLQNGDRVRIRPSGTEPKLKIYLGVKRETMEDAKAALAMLVDDVEGKLRRYVDI